MTIHSSHPFATPDGEKSPVRQMRGRLPAPVSVWAAGSESDRVGLTVSSFVLVDGEPGRVVGVLDPESEFWLAAPVTMVVNVLGDGHQFLADAFAGTAPAPGGPFTLAKWRESQWGPVLDDAVGWIGVRLDDSAPRDAGWGLIVDVAIEHVESTEADPLLHARGRYRTL